MKKIQITFAFFKGNFRISCLIGVLFYSLILLLPIEGRAEHTRRLELEDMVGASQKIAIGRVSQSESKWDGRFIYTTTTIEIEETIKGDPDDKIDIVQLGGTAVHPRLGASVNMSVSDMVQFEMGEEVLLFLERRPGGGHDLVGGAQGKFEIREDPDTKVRKLPVGPKSVKGLKEGDARSIATEDMTLDSMRERIRSYMKQKNKN